MQIMTVLAQSVDGSSKNLKKNGVHAKKCCGYVTKYAIL